MRKQILMFLLATGASVGGIFTVQPASADCLVNLGTCDSTGYCAVNVALTVPGVPPVTGDPFFQADGNCSSGGSCTINLGNCLAEGSCTVNTDLGSCTTEGACTVNDGTCNNGACTINSGDCTNNDGSLICLNTQCNANPGTDDKSYTGQWCVMDFAGNEASGVVFNDPTKEFGEVTAYMTVVSSDPVANPISDVTIICTMQSVPTHGAGGVARSVTQSGNTAVLADTISFNRVPGAPSYLCSEVSWNSSKGNTVIYFDDDNDASNGIQCDEYTYTN